MVINSVRGEGVEEGWNLRFRRTLFEWEAQELESLQQRLGQVFLNQDREDVLQWRWSADNNFSVKSVYDQWEGNRFESNGKLGAIWKNTSPPKVEIFVWMALQNRIAARSILLQ